MEEKEINKLSDSWVALFMDGSDITAPKNCTAMKQL